MQAYGSDRVRPLNDGARVILGSRYPKGWQARSGRTPGTAIVWDEAWFEVVAVEPLPQGAVRYVLEPWRDENAMRLTDRYDAESEAARFAQWRASLAREQKRKALSIGAMFAGYLPAQAQEELASDFGVPALRMTNLSMMCSMLIVGVLAAFAAGAVTGRQGHEEAWFIPALCLLAETGARFFVAGSQSRPVGSVIGTLVYIIARPKKAFRRPKGLGTFVREEPADARLRDAFTLREPLVTLLSPAEQERVAQRFDYDYRRHGPSLAWLILVFAAAGAITSLHTLRVHASLSAFLSLIAAGGIAIEQVLRLIAFRRGPAGSVLGVVARVVTRKLLA
jgi:hypothetical protein